MSFKKPFIVASLLLSSLAPLQAAEFNAPYQQQQELACSICHSEQGLDGDIFILDCGDARPVVTHVACMRDWIEQGRMYCPAGRYHLIPSDQLAIILDTLVGVEPVMHDDQFDDELFARVLLAEFEEASRIAVEQEEEDARFARALAGIVADDLEREVIAPAPVVQAPQPQNNQQQAAQAEDEQDECSICMDDLNNGGAVAALPCHHNFHHRCITDWLSNNPTCPLCRTDVQPEQIIGQQPVLVN